MKALTIRIMAIVSILTSAVMAWDKMPVSAEWTITGSEFGIVCLLIIAGFVLWDKAEKIEED